MKNNARSYGRQNNEIRPTSIEPNILLSAEGSCLIKVGNTHVICSATIEDTLPHFMKGQKSGWITAEYSLLPRSTASRVKREAAIGKLNGRTQEIQRLIGRTLRTAVDLQLLGERQIIIDCDVLNADGGTRTAAITGGFVALALAIKEHMRKGLLKVNPIINQIAAISCGIINNNIIVDLDYMEDSSADVDANFVFTSSGKIVEIQATAEKSLFSDSELYNMLELARQATLELFKVQQEVLK